jgi:hypothetical protein
MPEAESGLTFVFGAFCEVLHEAITRGKMIE